MATLVSSDITYCEGSLLLQSSPRTDIGQILIQRPNGGLVCQHCYLIVADANEVRAIKPDQDWSLLVSCHVQACGSLHDRRAAYSCYACLERGKMSVEPSMLALREHLKSCELVRLSESQQKQMEAPPSFAGGRSNTRKSGGGPQLGYAMGLPPLNRHRTQPDGPATPLQQAPSHSALFAEANPPLPSRPKSGAPSGEDWIYTRPTTRGSAAQPAQASTSRSNEPDPYNYSTNFSGPTDAAPDSRASSLHNYSPTVPRRKEIRTEAPEYTPEKTFSHAPNRAPPAPPVLSAPAPPPYYQGKDAHSQQGPPSATQDAPMNAFSSAETAKIQQLVSLGIPKMDAEYLLNRTGGDVNAAAELQLSEMGSLSPVREGTGQGGMAGGFPSPLGSNPTERRNRRSK